MRPAKFWPLRSPRRIEVLPDPYSGPPRSAERTHKQTDGTVVCSHVGLEVANPHLISGEDAHAPAPSKPCRTIAVQGSDPKPKVELP